MMYMYIYIPLSIYIILMLQLKGHSSPMKVLAIASSTFSQLVFKPSRAKVPDSAEHMESWADNYS